MIKITLPSGFEHYLEGPEAINSYSTSANTCAALQAAYDAGDWEACEPEEEPAPAPDPRAFKIALMGDPLFQQWQEDIPAIRREDLKLAAIADNWPLVQVLYDQLKAAILMPEGAAAQWQALADAHAIPLIF